MKKIKNFVWRMFLILVACVAAICLVKVGGFILGLLVNYVSPIYSAYRMLAFFFNFADEVDVNYSCWREETRSTETTIIKSLKAPFVVHNETSNEPERQSADTQRDDFQKTLLEQNLKTSKLPGVMEERTLAERTELAAKQKAIIERYRLEHSTTTFLKSSGEHWYELLDELVGTLREREQVFIRELVEDWAPDYTRSIDADEQSTILIFFIMLGFDNLTVAEFLDLARKLEADSLLDTEVQRHGTGELILTLKEAHPVFGHNVWIDAIRKTRKYIEIQKQVLTEDTPRFEKLYLLNFLRQHRFVLQHDPELVRFLKFPTREVYGEHYPVLLNNIYKLYVRGDQGTITFPANLTITPEQWTEKKNTFLFYYCVSKLSEEDSLNLVLLGSDVCDPYVMEIYKLEMLNSLEEKSWREGYYKNYFKKFSPLLIANAEDSNFKNEKLFYSILRKRFKEFLVQQHYAELQNYLENTVPKDLVKNWARVKDNDFFTKFKILLLLDEAGYIKDPAVKKSIDNIIRYEWKEMQENGRFSRETEYFLAMYPLDDDNIVDSFRNEFNWRKKEIQKIVEDTDYFYSVLVELRKTKLGFGSEEENS